MPTLVTVLERTVTGVQERVTRAETSGEHLLPESGAVAL